MKHFFSNIVDMQNKLSGDEINASSIGKFEILYETNSRIRGRAP